VKTQIIQLEAHDDTLSVRDKMDWSQTPRVLLVWPEKGKVLRNRLDLILLERFCSSHGSQLALLTKDPEVQFQAKEAGIPVFQSRSEAQLQPWGKSFREFRRQELQKYAAENLPASPLRREAPQPRLKPPLWIKIPVFTIGVFAVLTLAGFLLPSADIILKPNVTKKTLTIPVQAQPDENQINLAGMIPARELLITVDGQLSTPTTGTVPIPGEYSRGEVVFTNLGEESIYIPSQTILSTEGDDPVLFRTLTAGSTPPGLGGEITLAVEAYLPGKAGNVPADQITKINMKFGADLRVTNTNPTNGGTDLLVPAPTLVDRLKLSREMTQLLEETARQKIQTELAEGDIALTDRLSDSEILKEEYTPGDNSHGELLWLDKTIQYRIYYTAMDDLEELAGDLVKTQYAGARYTPDLTSIQVLQLSSPERHSDGNYHWEIQVSWVESQIVRKEKVIDWILAKPVHDAQRSLLENLDLEKDPQIVLHPGWWPRIPALPFRIHFEGGGY